jgi:hypothetical protein
MASQRTGALTIMIRFLSVLFPYLLSSAFSVCASPLSLPAGTAAILDNIYSGRSDLAIAGARQLQQQSPDEPLGYILEAEALSWKIWCAAAEYKYGMTMARHKEKQSADQAYLELTSKALLLAETKLKVHESAEMYFYAGMAEALAAKMHGLRSENRNAAHDGVRAREHLNRALASDPSLADADLGLGLYDYYVDTLSATARVLRFFMGIPGGSKADGIRRLEHAMLDGQLTRSSARFYLAINLHNYDQRYEEALQILTPLVQQYPGNPVFLLAQGDLYGKLGRNSQALAAYHAAATAAANLRDEACQKKIEALVQQSAAAISQRSTGP